MDIESSAEYQALLVAAAGKPERSMGESVIPAEPPVWREVKQQALALLSEPPHVSVLVHLVKADSHLGGFPAMRQSLQTLHDQLAQFWDTALPEADPDDPDDAYFERVNYLREIAEDPAFINTIQNILLVDARGVGAFNARDIDIGSGQLTASEEDMARCQDGLIRAAFEQSDVGALQNVHEAFETIDKLFAALNQLLDERAGRDHGLSFAPVRQRVLNCAEKFELYAGSTLAEQAAKSEPASEPSDQQNIGVSGEQPKLPVADDGRGLTDRAAVCVAFDQIILYYLKYEPSSPVPVLAQRARDMVTKSFFDVIEDLVPAEKGNLPALLSVLHLNPLAHLFNDSYQRFVSGEVVGVQSNGMSSETATDTIDNQDGAPEPSLKQGAGSELQSRNDVAGVLASIDKYFSQHEPASPIPLIVAEIRKLLPKQFTELIQEFNIVLNPPANAVDE